MVTFRICLVEKWETRTERHNLQGPFFHVYKGTENQRLCSVNLLMDPVDIETLLTDANTQQIDKIIPTVLRYAIRRIEQGLREGSLPPPPSPETYNLFVEETGLLALRQLLQKKTCTYQTPDGRDLLCSAATSDDATRCGQVGFRTVAPTSQAICRACTLPDTDYLCSHFLHPGVRAEVDRGKLEERRLIGGICDLGKPEIERPVQCHAGGNACWERLIEIENESSPAYASPLTLPEAFDFLDTAWRLAFGKKPGLLRRQSTASSAELALSCTTRDEFVSRLSALADTLKAMEIPDALLTSDAQEINKDQTFNRLLSCLQSRLEEADYQAVKGAIDTLRAVNGVRVALQHTGAAYELPAALEKLRIPYPPQWEEDWDRIRAKTVEALRVIRERVLTIS